MSRAANTAEVVSLSVHGPVGVLDLQVPVAASAADVAIEYARQARLPSMPRLYTRLGHPLEPGTTLSDAGVASGAVLVALPPDQVPGPLEDSRRAGGVLVQGRLATGPLSVLWFCVAGALAVLSGWFAATLPPSDLRTTTVALLVLAAGLGCLPLGPLAAHRVLVAPAFAGAAAFALAWDPAPERLPTIFGAAALAAAVTAAVARSLGEEAEEGLRVWMVVGVLVFLTSGLAALVDAPSPVVWAVFVVVAMLSARFVPMLAIDVPDQFLIDLERLAVTAWSARERPRGRRVRTVVPHQAVAAVAARGTRMITAACTAIFVVVSVSSVLLIRDADLPLDRVGARCLVGFSGAALLLAARSYRHTAARGLLRAAGLACWAVLAVALVDLLGSRGTGLLATAAIVLAALLVVVAVALGRGWRSAWWSRRAEIAEGLCGAFAVGSVVVAVGLFRRLWELTG